MSLLFSGKITKNLGVIMKARYVILAISTSLWANMPQSKVLDLYPNASFLNYNFKVKSGKFQTNLPGFVNLKNLSTRTSCQILNSQLSEIEGLHVKVQEELKALESEGEKLAIKLVVIKAQEDLLRTFNLEKTPMKSIKQKSATFGSLLEKNLLLQIKIDKDIKKIDKEINRLKDIRGTKKDKSLVMQLHCDKPADLKVSFPLQNIKYKTIQNFNANTSLNRLDISQVAYITHSLDDILQKVNIRFYSFLYNQNLNPVRFMPRYIQNYKARYAKANKELALAPAPTMAKSSNMQIADAVSKASMTKRVWESKAINLKAGEENEVVFAKQNLKVEFGNFIDGYGSVKAYLKGTFTPKEFIEAGDANIILDGVQMGKTYVKELPKGEKTHLYFGQNDLIKIKKVLSKIYTNDSLFGTSMSTQKIWDYEITNLGEKPQNITLIEQMPITTHERITIKPLSNPKPDKEQKDGEVSWKFSLNQNGQKHIKFGYEVEKPTQ